MVKYKLLGLMCALLCVGVMADMPPEWGYSETSTFFSTGKYWPPTPTDYDVDPLTECPTIVDGLVTIDLEPDFQYWTGDTFTQGEEVRIPIKISTLNWQYASEKYGCTRFTGIVECGIWPKEKYGTAFSLFDPVVTKDGHCSRDAPHVDTKLVTIDRSRSETITFTPLMPWSSLVDPGCYYQCHDVRGDSHENCAGYCSLWADNYEYVVECIVARACWNDLDLYGTPTEEREHRDTVQRSRIVKDIFLPEPQIPSDVEPDWNPWDGSCSANCILEVSGTTYCLSDMDNSVCWANSGAHAPECCQGAAPPMESCGNGVPDEICEACPEDYGLDNPSGCTSAEVGIVQKLMGLATVPNAAIAGGAALVYTGNLPYGVGLMAVGVLANVMSSWSFSFPFIG